MKRAAMYQALENIESTKRRRALDSGLDADSRLFFERLLIVKKNRELVFITKNEARGR